MSKDKSKSKDKSSSKKSRKSSSCSSSAAIESISLTVPPTSSTSSSVPSTSVSSAFETLYPILNLPIPPVWSSDPYSAFSDLMDTLVMRYVPQLSGVLITHSPTRFLQDTAVFSADSAFATANVGFECVVWRPKIGQVLEGTICLSSPSHVSLLLYGLFNASIPASHLPEEEWEFVLNEMDTTASDHGLGHWRNRSTGERLGGSSGKLQFTVISLTIANHMLSLHGSLLPEPFKGPPPTLDRSYLKKSLIPSQAMGLGTAAARASPAAEKVEKEKQPRRVRWEDESSDMDAAEEDQGLVVDDDVQMMETPASVIKAETTEETGKKKEKKEKKSKRKSTGESGTDGDAVASPKRDKKRRKEA